VDPVPCRILVIFPDPRLIVLLYKSLKMLKSLAAVLFCVIKICQLGMVPSNGVMSSPFLHKTIFFSESFSGDLMLYIAIKFY
jgi:hypothetical protein